MHLSRDSTIFPTETPGAEENNTLEDKYGCFLPLSGPGFYTFPSSHKDSCYMTQTF